MTELRPYQARDVERIRASYLSGHKAPLYVAPPGAGKTVMFAYICRGANARGNRVLVLCHRTELIEQISAALTDQGVEHGYIAADYPYRRGHSVYVASVFTLARRLEVFRPDLVVVDEAHHTVASTTWGKILQAYAQAKRLGVTATPCRLSGEGLDAYYDDLIVGPTHEELIDEGYLTPLRAYAPPTIETRGLHTRAGDYIPAEVVERVDRTSVTGDAVEHYARLCPGRRAVVFDVSVEAARKRAAAFRAAGFTAECLDGTLDRSVRAVDVADFRAGRTQVLTSVDIVSEGFDLPAIEVGISLRPTQSLGLWLQQTGRILRPLAGKSVALLFDHSGNCYRHGFPTERRDWSLAGVPAARDGGESQRSVRVCTACFAVNSQGARICKACGVPFPIEARKVPTKKGDLTELTPDELRAKRLQREQHQEQERAKTLEALINLGRIRGMRNPEGWAEHVYAARRAKGRA